MHYLLQVTDVFWRSSVKIMYSDSKFVYLLNTFCKIDVHVKHGMLLSTERIFSHSAVVEETSTPKRLSSCARDCSFVLSLRTALSYAIRARCSDFAIQKKHVQALSKLGKRLKFLMLHRSLTKTANGHKTILYKLKKSFISGKRPLNIVNCM